MEDNQIIDLYWQRSEEAIIQTSRKYGNYCRSIASHILSDPMDCEECINDTYLKAWNIIPPRRPKRLSTFLGKIVRNLSLDKLRYYCAQKRINSEATAALDELTVCTPTSGSEDEIIEEMVLTEVLNRFLASLKPESRKIFMQRYWYFRSVSEIAQDYQLTESKVKMSLMRSRNQLKALLEKEGVSL